jgi:hypothetical protein
VAGSSEPGRSALGRALAVLGSCSDERPQQTLGMIAAGTGRRPRTGWWRSWSSGARSSGPRGRYRIGIRLWQLGSLAPVTRDLRDALPS